LTVGQIVLTKRICLFVIAFWKSCYFDLAILISLQYYDFCPKWSSGVDENDVTYQETKLFTGTQVAKVKKILTLLCHENK
jgi:hypothetical protein